MQRMKYLTALAVSTVVVVSVIPCAASFAQATADPPAAKTQKTPQTLLVVVTTPKGAQIRLDGKKLGTSDGLFPVQPGEYKIVVDLTGHQPYEQKVTVRDGRITRIELKLKPAAGSSQVALPVPVEPTAHDDKLTDAQRLFRDWTEENFSGRMNQAAWRNLSGNKRSEMERQWIKELSAPEGRAAVPAINALAAIRSRKAVPGLLNIASDRREKDNQDRWMAVRALGLIGDQGVVPDLVHLTYHYNLNTRFWAQISLVRLTGQNLGRDVAAWKRWWEKQGGKPAVSEETVAWTSNAEWADQRKQEEYDREVLEKLKARGKGGDSQAGGVPEIVATSPAVGATEVDPATTEITVTFDRDMRGGFSWTGGGPEYPTVPEGKQAHWRDRRTCVLPVKLETGRFYRVGINSTSYQNFRSVQGTPARPSAIYFTTRGASDELKNRARVPQIVSMNPPNGAADVDPKLKQLRVTFNLPMGGGFSWTGGGPQFPEIPDGKSPSWTDDGKTCVLPVRLKPGWDYRLGLNSPSHKNFQSEGGVPLEPVVYSFRTRDR